MTTMVTKRFFNLCRKSGLWLKFRQYAELHMRNFPSLGSNIRVIPCRRTSADVEETAPLAIGVDAPRCKYKIIQSIFS